MNVIRLENLILAAALATLAARPVQAQIVVSEVDALGSSASYGADWFELTNTGSAAVDISGWKMDDNSNSFAASVALRGVSSIGAGQSVVFIETSSGSTDTATDAAFKSAWFGSAPNTVVIGNYQGSGVGLGSSTDAVNIFNGSGSVVTRVDFGASSTGTTFDNAAGLNNVTLAQQSAIGVHGAFLSANGAEVGSPGSISSVPEPRGIVLAVAGFGAISIAVRRRSTTL